jgi:hypothetical protein
MSSVIRNQSRRGFSWDVYSSGPGLQRLWELVEPVNYEGLRLDHLYATA